MTTATATATDRYNTNLTCNVRVTPIALTDAEAQQHGYTRYAHLTMGQLAKIKRAIANPKNVNEVGVDRVGKVDRADIYFGGC